MAYLEKLICPIPKDVLLEMVKEENKVRTSEEFQTKIAEEKRIAKTDGSNSIVELQVIFNDNEIAINPVSYAYMNMLSFTSLRKVL